MGIYLYIWGHAVCRMIQMCAGFTSRIGREGLSKALRIRILFLAVLCYSRKPGHSGDQQRLTLDIDPHARRDVPTEHLVVCRWMAVCSRLS